MWELRYHRIRYPRNETLARGVYVPQTRHALSSNYWGAQYIPKYEDKWPFHYI